MPKKSKEIENLENRRAWEESISKSPEDARAELLTPEEAAERLRVTVRTIYTRLRTGQIPGIKHGGSWRVNLFSLLPHTAVPKEDADDSSIQYQLHMWANHNTADKVTLTRTEYLALKAYLAGMRSGK